jgi:hypothetical protein
MKQELFTGIVHRAKDLRPSLDAKRCQDNQTAPFHAIHSPDLLLGSIFALFSPCVGFSALAQVFFEIFSCDVTKWND